MHLFASRYRSVTRKKAFQAQKVPGALEKRTPGRTVAQQKGKLKDNEYIDIVLISFS